MTANGSRKTTIWKQNEVKGVTKKQVGTWREAEAESKWIMEIQRKKKKIWEENWHIFRFSGEHSMMSTRQKVSVYFLTSIPVSFHLLWLLCVLHQAGNLLLNPEQLVSHTRQRYLRDYPLCVCVHVCVCGEGSVCAYVDAMPKSLTDLVLWNCEWMDGRKNKAEEEGMIGVRGLRNSSISERHTYTHIHWVSSLNWASTDKPALSLIW